MSPLSKFLELGSSYNGANEMNISIQLPALSALVLVASGVVFGAGFSYGHSAQIGDRNLPTPQIRVEQVEPSCPLSGKQRSGS
jgi:hypothetical protein